MNVGTIPAKVLNVTAKGLEGTDHIVIKGLDVIESNHPTINAGDKCNIHFTVEWPVEKATEIAENEVATFELKVEYVQSTGANFDGQASHEEIEGNTTSGTEVVTPPEVKTGKLTEIITGADYGKSINYKATVQGQEVSNWKVFLNDENNVYIILDDYLENSLVPDSAGLTKGDTEKPYNVWLGSRDTLVSSLTEQSNWSEFASGVEGATATGSPTNAQFVESWNKNPEVNERQLAVEGVYNSTTDEEHKIVTDSTKLYIPNTEIVNGCQGYWLASPFTANNYAMWRVQRLGYIGGDTSECEDLGIRPVVCLPSNITGTVGTEVEI